MKSTHSHILNVQSNSCHEFKLLVEFYIIMHGILYLYLFSISPSTEAAFMPIGIVGKSQDSYGYGQRLWSSPRYAKCSVMGLHVLMYMLYIRPTFINTLFPVPRRKFSKWGREIIIININILNKLCKTDLILSFWSLYRLLSFFFARSAHWKVNQVVWDTDVQ